MSKTEHTGRVVTFGELLLRLTDEDVRNGFPNLSDARFGGSEANVAVSLATLGNEVSYLTRLPEGRIGDAAVAKLATLGIDTSQVLRKGDKIGTYYLEQGASRQKAQTIYDRDDTAYSTLRPGDIDWRQVLSGASVFHVSGITAAISQSASDTVMEALDVADELGLTVSFDINYRKGLWNYGADARETLIGMMQRADIMFGDVLEYEFITQHEPMSIDTSAAEYTIDLNAYEEWFGELHALCPRCGKMLIGTRSQIAPTHHALTALLLSDGQMYSTKIYDIKNVVDPVGVGDAFAAGSIHAALRFPDDAQRWLDYSLAAAVLKNRVKGDFNLSTNEEIEALMATAPTQE